MKQYFSIPFLAFLVGCTTQIPQYYTDAEMSYQNITCTHDQFERKTTCITPFISNTKRTKSENGTNKVDYVSEWDLRSMAFRTVQTDTSSDFDSIQLYFSMKQKGWAFYNAAYDKNGNKLKFVEIDSSVLDYGWTKEEFAIVVTKSYLSKYQNEELILKLVGKKKDAIFTIQPEFIQGVIKHLKNPRKKH